jgi:hypothetical protein
MPESRHEMILASRVVEAPVLNRAGERIGHVADLSIHKQSGEAIYAILSFGGFLGLGERWHPVPWPLLEYDAGLGGYVLPIDTEDLKKAPSLSREELEDLGGGEPWSPHIADYYAAMAPLV